MKDKSNMRKRIYMSDSDFIEKSKLSYPVTKGISFKQQNPTIYTMIHKFLNDHFIKSKICDICGHSNKKRYEFALIKGRNYSYNRNDYMVLCVSCHKNYDHNPETGLKIRDARLIEIKNGNSTIANLFKGKIGKDHNCSTPVAMIDIKTSEVVEEFDSLASVQRKYNYKVCGISSVLNGRRRTAYGYSWIKI